MARSQASRSPSRGSPCHSPSRDRDPGEHVETPLRKKARTDPGEMSPMRANPTSVPSTPQAFRQQYSHAASRPSPRNTPGEDRPHTQTPVTPSKITLNLKRSNDYGRAIAQSSAVAQPTSSLNSPRSDTIEIAELSPAHSPEAVDISLDGDATDEDISSVNVNDGEVIPVEERLYGEFPEAQPHCSPEAVVEAWCQSLNRNSPCLKLQTLYDLDEWLTKWIRWNLDDLTACQDAFLHQHAQLWSNLGLFFAKLLAKKCSFDTGAFTLASSSHVVQHLLTSWLQICAMALEVDHEQIQQALDVQNTSAPELCAQYALSFIIKVFNPQSVFWLYLNDTKVLDADNVLEQLCLNSTSTEPALYLAIQKLAEKSTVAFLPWQDAICKHMTSAIRALASISNQLGHLEDLSPVELTAYSRNSTATNLHLSELLRQSLVSGPPKSTLSPAFYQEAFSCMQLLVHQTRSSGGPALFELTSVKVQNVDAFDLTATKLLIFHSTVQEVLWHLIKKGRMELRVWAVKYYSDNLIQVHESRRKTGVPSDQDVVLLELARILDEQHFLDYIIGVDSHPQLITRSGSILAFLIVCGQWQRDMTVSICQAVASSQDSRIKTAIIDMLSGQPAELMDIEQKWFLCEQLSTLPYAALDGEIIDCMFRIISHAANSGRADRNSDIFSAPLTFCHLVLKRCFSDEAQGQAQTERVFEETTRLLQKIVEIFGCPPDSMDLFRDCLDGIRDAHKSSAGSMQFMLTLLKFGPEMLLTRTFQEFPMSTLVADNICTFVEEATQNCPNEAPMWQALDIRMTFLSLCLEYDKAFEVGDDLEKRLWNNLFGSGALSDKARDVAWTRLENLATNITTTTHPFLDRCMDLHISNLDPDILTYSALKFVEKAIAYRVRIARPQPDSRDIIAVPLSSFLWHSMTAPDDAVYCAAAKIMCNNYLEADFIREAHPESIKATHTEFVSVCIRHLEQAAAAINTESSDLTVEYSPWRSGSPFVQFCRSLDLLGMFLARVKEIPCFHRQQSQSPSPSSSSSRGTHGDVTHLKYQAFWEDGHGSEIKEMRISTLASLADLHFELCKKIRASNVSIVHRGSRLDLTDTGPESIKLVAQGGLLLVKCASDSNSTLRTQPTLANTVAEETVLCDLDTFYSFLEKPRDISYPTRQFMMQFPPHQRPIDLVADSSADTCSQLFPLDHPDMALYNLESLKKEFARMMHAGTVDNDWVSQTIGIFCNMTVRLPALEDMENKSLMLDISFWIIDTMILFLKQGTGVKTDDSFGDKEAMVMQLVSFMKPERGGKCAHLCMQSYAAVVEMSLHCKAIWTIFTSRSDTQALHEKLFLEYAGSSPCGRPVLIIIGDVCNGIVKSKSGLSPADFRAFYWPLIKSAVSNTPEHPTLCAHIFELVANVFPAVAEELSEDDIHMLFRGWIDVLLRYNHSEIPGQDQVDHFLLGMTGLLLHCVRYLKAFKKPIGCSEAMTTIFRKYLFPPLFARTGDVSPGDTSNPVLESATRRELYHLVLTLCEDTNCLDKICALLQGLAEDEERQSTNLSYLLDHTSMLRAPVGFSGLRNLTNTCYMNSLMTQLFMNTGFREFFITANSGDSTQDRQLLSATKQLFTRMLQSHSKFEDTEQFTAAIQPYDAESIDVTVQMDADEFFNLLFDRWESQLPDRATRERFRSFFGGQLVTQIKSLDCQHISERLEDCFAIQCEVKGKANLNESLEAYVQGDVMEGDNKYKCESCGGRFVNAVKRSCFKKIPDSVIFHLKRFDFDLITMQRSKINDRFEFPLVLDMSIYNVAHLEKHDASDAPDIFELAGVLVHSGTAETGHYYSYIRDESKKRQDNTCPWLEFNDTLVDEYDSGRLAADTFGGEMDDGQGQWHWMKPNSAYMLFYRRRTDLEQNQMITKGKDDRSTLAEKDEIHDTISFDNSSLLRRLCQINPAHSLFMQQLLTRLRTINNGVCSEGHELEDRIIASVIRQLDQFASHSRHLDEFEGLLHQLLAHVLPCGKCCASVVEYLSHFQQVLQNLLLSAPVAKVRVAMQRFLSGLTSKFRMSHADNYGVSISTDINEDLLDWTPHGPIPRLVAALAEFMYSLGRSYRLWTEYFDLLADIASLGLPEVALLLHHDVLLNVCTILSIHTETHHAPTLRHEHNFAILERVKKVPWVPLARPFSILLQHVNIFDKTVRDAGVRTAHFDWALRRFPLTTLEQRIILFSRPKRGFIFLGRVLELFDNDTPDISPQLAMVESITPLAKETHNLNSLALAIATNLPDWHPWAIRPALEIALAFCRYSLSASALGPILSAVVKNAMAINQSNHHDPTVERGGRFHLSFFRRVAGANDFACLEEYEQLQRMVLAKIHCWVPQILYFEVRDVRDSTVTWLDNTIFRKFPLMEKDDEPVGLDIARTEAVRELLSACYRRLEDASNHNRSVTRVKELVEVSQQCARWFKRIYSGQQDAVPGYTTLLGTNSDYDAQLFVELLTRMPFNEADAEEAPSDDVFATETDDALDSGDEYEDEPSAE